MPKAQIKKRRKKKKRKGKEPHQGPKLNYLLFFCFNCFNNQHLASCISSAKHSNGSHYSACISGITTNTSPSRRRLFGNLACLQIQYVSRKLTYQTIFPPRRQCAYAKNQQPLTQQLIISVSYYLLSMITVLMKLFWCVNETGQDKQMRKQKGFRIIQNVHVLSHIELNLGPPKGI